MLKSNNNKKKKKNVIGTDQNIVFSNASVKTDVSVENWFSFLYV